MAKITNPPKKAKAHKKRYGGGQDRPYSIALLKRIGVRTPSTHKRRDDV